MGTQQIFEFLNRYGFNFDLYEVCGYVDVDWRVQHEVYKHFASVRERNFIDHIALTSFSCN